MAQIKCAGSATFTGAENGLGETRFHSSLVCCIHTNVSGKANFHLSPIAVESIARSTGLSSLEASCLKLRMKKATEKPLFSISPRKFDNLLIMRNRNL